MNPATAMSSSYFDTSEDIRKHLNIAFKGRMDIENAPDIFKSLQPLIAAGQPTRLTIDLDRVTALDEYGALVITQLKRRFALEDDHFRIINTSRLPRQIIDQIDFPDMQRCTFSFNQKHTGKIVTRLGDSTLSALSNVRLIIAFLGSVFFAFVRVLRNPKSLRIDDTLTHMENTGVYALPIVAMISFLLGLIIAFMSSIQLQQFGANIYVASLVALAMVSELGPIMTAIIVAGRTGSSFAAEIGTMKISEEVDALFSMGFDPTCFLVIPRMLASIIVVPVLTLFANIFAIAGGMVIGVLMLKLSPGSYIAQTIKTLTMFGNRLGTCQKCPFCHTGIMDFLPERVSGPGGSRFGWKCRYIRCCQQHFSDHSVRLDIRRHSHLLEINFHRWKKRS